MTTLREFRKAARAAALRGRPLQMTTQAAAKLAAFLDKVEGASVEVIDFINTEYACAHSSALDGDPIERGEVRVVRDRLCSILE